MRKILSTLVVGLIACAATAGDAPKAGTTKKDYGKMPDGTAVDEYTLTNAKGMSMKVITLGGIVTELNVPDKDGKFGDVALGCSNLEEYLGGHPFFGALSRPSLVLFSPGALVGPGAFFPAPACIVIANRTDALGIACFEDSPQVARVSPGIASRFADGEVDRLRRELRIAIEGRQNRLGFLELCGSYLAGADTVAGL